MHNTLLFENMSVLFWILALLISFVFVLPSIIAFSRRHKYRWIILAINIIFGATGVGWLIAFIWAVWPQKTSLVDPIGDPSGKGGMAKEFGERTATYNHYAQNRPKANFCGNCGEKLSDTANFCGSCGNEVNSSGIQGYDSDYEQDYSETTVVNRPNPLKFILVVFWFVWGIILTSVGILGLFVQIPALEIDVITQYGLKDKTSLGTAVWATILDTPLWVHFLFIILGILTISYVLSKMKE